MRRARLTPPTPDRLSAGCIRAGKLLSVRLFSSAQQKRTLIKLRSQPCVFFLQTMALALNQHQACGQRLNFCCYFALALFDLTQLFMLIDAFTSLPVA